MEEKKKIYKKWWFWVIIAVIIGIVIIGIKEYISYKKVQEGVDNFSNSMTNYANGFIEAEGYLDEFNETLETNEIEYTSIITLEKFDLIQNGMTEDEVTRILGEGEKSQPEGNYGFMISYGDLYLSNPPYYAVQIIFNSSSQVINKMQIGLK